MKKFAAALALCCLASVAIAETLASQAVLCETADALDLLEQENLKGQPGPTVMTRIKASLDLYELSAQVNRSLKGVSPSRERRMRAQTDELSDLSKAETYKRFLGECSIVSASQPVTVLESKPISGKMRVNAVYNGAQAALWTKNYFVKQ
jgi:hypothetical protein